MALMFKWFRQWSIHTGGTKFYEVSRIECNGIAHAAIARYGKYNGSGNLKGQAMGQVEVLEMSPTTASADILKIAAEKIRDKRKPKSGESYKDWGQVSEEFLSVKEFEEGLKRDYPTAVWSPIVELLKAIDNLPDFDPLPGIRKDDEEYAARVRAEREVLYKDDEDFASW